MPTLFALHPACSYCTVRTVTGSSQRRFLLSWLAAEFFHIDLSKMTVLPGLIDCHTHVASGAYDSKDLDIFTKTAAQYALESVPNARTMLESGFTTVRDVGTIAPSSTLLCATPSIVATSSVPACS